MILFGLPCVAIPTVELLLPLDFVSFVYASRLFHNVLYRDTMQFGRVETVPSVRVHACVRVCVLAGKHGFGPAVRWRQAAVKTHRLTDCTAKTLLLDDFQLLHQQALHQCFLVILAASLQGVALCFGVFSSPIIFNNMVEKLP